MFKVGDSQIRLSLNLWFDETSTEVIPMRFDITALYCCLDDFTKLYEDCERHHLIEQSGKRRRKGKLSLSEMLLIMILFHRRKLP